MRVDWYQLSRAKRAGKNVSEVSSVKGFKMQVSRPGSLRVELLKDALEKTIRGSTKPNLQLISTMNGSASRRDDWRHTIFRVIQAFHVMRFATCHSHGPPFWHVEDYMIELQDTGVSLKPDPCGLKQMEHPSVSQIESSHDFYTYLPKYVSGR